jgi:putative hydrolase of the HAD superfamily
MRAPHARLVKIGKPGEEVRRIGFVTVRAVIFDWGGTLTPWHTIDPLELWRSVCTPHFPAADAPGIAEALVLAEQELWGHGDRDQRSATMDQVFTQAGITASAAFLASYTTAWEPHTLTDPEAPGLLRSLRDRDIKIGVLSNTMWPRAWHEAVFTRDGIAGLIDGAVYSSEIPWTKPHPEAFRAAMRAVGISEPADCVFVGDRPYDDVHGAKSIGMRAVLIPHSEVPAFDEVTPDAVITTLSELGPLIEAWSGADSG